MPESDSNGTYVASQKRRLFKNKKGSSERRMGKGHMVTWEFHILRDIVNKNKCN